MRTQTASLRLRIPLLALGMLAFLAAMWAGLLRLGWPFLLLRPSLPVAHGPLMVCGFLGTVIGLERAVASTQRWPYIMPLLTGIGGILLIVHFSTIAGPLLMTLGSMGLTALFVVFLRQQFALHMVIIASGTILWLLGNVLWVTGWPMYHLVPWWSGFLVLTITGERLELSRMLSLTPQQRLVCLLALGLYVTGLVLSLLHLDAGIRLSGVGLLLLAGWLWRHDIARRTVRQTGVTRYVAVSLLAGYVWLVVYGLFLLAFGGIIAGPSYDAMVHALFVGFVLSMIFGHAPIIFPAILHVTQPIQATFYTPLCLLHLSLLLRIVGDLAGWWPGRQWGGLLNAVAVVLFLGRLVYTMVRSRTLTPAVKEAG